MDGLVPWRPAPHAALVLAYETEPVKPDVSQPVRDIETVDQAVRAGCLSLHELIGIAQRPAVPGQDVGPLGRFDPVGSRLHHRATAIVVPPCMGTTQTSPLRGQGYHTLRRTLGASGRAVFPIA